MAYRLISNDGQMDLGDAVRALRQAQAALPRAERRAAQIIGEARARVDQARSQVAAAIVEADRRGMRQRDIVAETGYSRERVRQIIRAAELDA